MKIYSAITLVTLAFTPLAQPVFAQSSTAVDPACIVTGADGSQTIDKNKCPDGLKPAVGAVGETTPLADTATTQSTTAAPEATSGTTSNPAASTDVIVPADKFANAKIMTASDFIG